MSTSLTAAIGIQYTCHMKSVNDTSTTYITSLVSTAEAARILEVTDRRVRQMIMAGKLPATKFGNTHIIPVKDVLEYKRRRDLQPAPKSS